MCVKIIRYDLEEKKKKERAGYVHDLHCFSDNSALMNEEDENTETL